ncbi:MAG TPA: sigma-70 family RNA polymerase sigma factor, partial [Polyangiales bacterium]
MSAPLAANFFRHEYGRLVAILVRRVGARHLEAIEDGVQSALLAAVHAWPRSKVPENPSAWLYRVAHHHVVGELRRSSRHGELAAEHVRGAEPVADLVTASLSGDLGDDLLRMLFVCCDDAIPIEAQLVLALKTLCGFDVAEIAERLFITEANVYKRLARARLRMRDVPLLAADLSGDQLASRRSAVHAILYTLFTEGYLSSHADGAIRRELCEEALRLATLLAEHPVGATPETYALLALMHLHSARLPARQDGSGGLLLLEEQDRSRWDPVEIQAGLVWLARAAEGDVFTRYHAEAGIAAEHCLAPSFVATRWDRIVACYELLERLAPSALHALNRAVAVAEHRGPEHGLAVLAGLEPPSWLLGSYQWSAVLSDLHRRAGHGEMARQCRESALEAAPSSVIREALA